MGMMTEQSVSNPTTSHGNYNGVVDVNGSPVQVKSGIAEVEGQPYFVSDNGALVLNHQGQLTGHIQNGKFVVVDMDYAKTMREKGYA